MQFDVFGTVQVSVTVTVEAESKEEAIEKAYEEFGGLSGYCGNGGDDKLVGTTEGHVSLDCGYFEPDFTDAEQKEG